MDCEDISHGLAQIVIDPPPEANGRDDRRKIVVQQDQRSCLARDVSAAAAHGDADMRRFQRRRVIDAIAGHGNDLAIGFQRIDDP